MREFLWETSIPIQNIKTHALKKLKIVSLYYTLTIFNTSQLCPLVQLFLIENSVTLRWDEKLESWETVQVWLQYCLYLSFLLMLYFTSPLTLNLSSIHYLMSHDFSFISSKLHCYLKQNKTKENIKKSNVLLYHDWGSHQSIIIAEYN